MPRNPDNMIQDFYSGDLMADEMADLINALLEERWPDYRKIRRNNLLFGIFCGFGFAISVFSLFFK
jgi:hypothetical protein